ncbi:uncharacterized protein [Dermacentor andersoni]|uniref:uncharacterized protein isoform X2 n=1 Tax=Dermacentor andersoni TaxID=34620 RepID=UPI0024168D07|nr:uncharacterized protein LOC129384665 isoform X2 [Dermacentor andersoni]
MALTVWNPNTELSLDNIAKMVAIREKPGYHIYFQGDGVPTTNGYTFTLVSHPVDGNPEVAVVLHIAPEWKTFVFNINYDDGQNHLHYKYPKAPGSTEAVATKQYNVKDKSLETPVTSFKILPGAHIVRFQIDTNNKLVQIFLKTENGRVFEAHQVADDGSSVFDNELGNDPRDTPPLVPGCFLEVKGEVANASNSPSFAISELSKYDKNSPATPQFTTFPVPLPAGAQTFVYYVKYCRKHLIIDAGAGMKVYSHNFKAPRRCYAKDLWGENINFVVNYLG